MLLERVGITSMGHGNTIYQNQPKSYSMSHGTRPAGPCADNMMTSSNGNIFRVIGHLCGEFTGLGEFPAQRPVTRCFDVFLDQRLNKRLKNNGEVGDLRRHRTHYDVTVINKAIKQIQDCVCGLWKVKLERLKSYLRCENKTNSTG